MFRKKSLMSLVSLLLMFTLLFPTQLMATAAPKTFTIVHTNDTHSRIEEGTYDGMGFAKVAAKINELRTSLGKENVLVLDAGDTLHGIPLSTISKGSGIVTLLNTIGYDAMTPGNHDFNYGQDRLVELSKMMNFPLISANVKKADGKTLLLPYTIKEINGVKVGIFGLSTPETTTKTHPNNVKGLTFEDPSKTAALMVKELQDKTDMIIALSHLGLDKGSVYTSEKVALDVPGIDLIVDGHSHTVLPEGKKVGNTLIVQTGEYDKNLGIVNVSLGADNKITFAPSLYTKENAATLIPDAVTSDSILKLKASFDELTSQKVGVSPIKLEGEREKVRTSQTNMGDLITDAMLDLTGADVALTNGGGIRASIKPGNITKKDIINVLPFGNYTVTLNVTGEEILAALEAGVSKYPAPEGCFPQVGGMTFTLNPSNPAGSRIAGVMIGDKSLDKTKTYSLATNDFLAAGGDGYTMLKGKKPTGEFSALDETVINYIATKGIPSKIRISNVIIIKKEPIEQSYVPVATPDKKLIVIPSKVNVVPVSTESKFIKYVIQPGDTLAKIAQKLGTSYTELAKINKISDVHKIFAGDTLLVPAK